MKLSFDQAKEYGFIFPGARDWYEPGRANQLARDAALVSTPNSAVPAEFTVYIDPRVVEIMTAPHRARELFGEVKKGDIATSAAKWRVNETVGRSQPYSDFAPNGMADVNINWLTREQYVFQTTIRYGDMESAMAGAAQIELAAAKQRAAATVLDTDANRFYLLGVAGKEIYGILNDPSLPAAIAAPPKGTGSSPLWANKNTVQRYNDVLTLFSELTRQSKGFISRDTPLVLALSPELEVQLGSATDFNVSVLDMLNKYFRDLKVVALPEFSGKPAGETMLLFAPEVAGMPSADLGFGVKLQAGRIVPELSALKQKWISSTYGGIVLIPFAFAQMTGM